MSDFLAYNAVFTVFGIRCMGKPIRYVALGDCNTVGEISNMGNAYPERVAKQQDWALENYGYTMSTTREGLQFFNLKDVKNADILSIQYGLVDSWLTFKGSPFVLYYPDSPWRKFLRKIVKKIKKYARKLNWHSVVGQANVVPVAEYKQNITYMIEQTQAKYILLLDIAPNKDMSREPQTLIYNQALHDLADGKRILHISYYDELKQNLDLYYDDSTHLSSVGQDVVTAKVLAALSAAEQKM
jgi:lysophospholipase L1-like esterase